MEFGGYTGEWAQQIINKYNPNVYIVEPVNIFYEGMITRFANNNKVHLMNVGVGIEDKDGFIYLNGDATSSSLVNQNALKITYKSIDTILKIWELKEIDLVQINIEGDEYPLLEHMLDTGLINRFKNIQIQFHLEHENAIMKRDKIREGLVTKGFRINFDYPFVWESWEKIIT